MNDRVVLVVVDDEVVVVDVGVEDIETFLVLEFLVLVARGFEDREDGCNEDEIGDLDPISSIFLIFL